MNKPVMIYIYMDGCPACERFKKEWNEIIKTKRARFIQIECGRSNPPDEIKKYVKWFPTILLANSKSYYNIFTKDDKYLASGKELEAQVYSGVFDGDELLHIPRTMNKNSIISWLNRIENKV